MDKKYTNRVLQLHNAPNKVNEPKIEKGLSFSNKSTLKNPILLLRHYIIEVYTTERFELQKICGLQSRAVSNQEQVMMACVRYVKKRPEIFKYECFEKPYSSAQTVATFQDHQ